MKLEIRNWKFEIYDILEIYDIITSTVMSTFGAKVMTTVRNTKSEK